MPSKAILILSGEPPPRAVLDERPALLIGVDGGGDVLDGWGERPDVVVGDMDSIRPATLARFRAEGVRIVEHPRDKDFTDAQLAIDLALAEGATEIVLAGATGRRLDLTVANLDLVLRAARKGARVRAYEASGRLWTVTPEAPFAADLPAGTTLSVLALTPAVEGLTESGVKFPLDRARLEAGNPYCVSNAALGGPVRVDIRSGVALVVLPGTAAFLRPPDEEDVAYEFFAPFAHVAGRYEWCRIRSPTHGVFDVLVSLGASTALPADVYVVDDAGARFMADRYPECRAWRAERLTIAESEGGRVVSGELAAATGPLRRARMRLAARPDARPRQVPYGGDGRPVWGSERFTCWGVDLALDAVADGELERADGLVERFAGAPAVVTLGSFGRIGRRP